MTVDPLNDFLDGTYHTTTTTAESKNQSSKSISKTSKSNNNNNNNSTDAIPSLLCSGHQRPCKSCIVKKAGPNKGRTFYVCSFPRGEQCETFEWANHSVEAAQQALAGTFGRSYSGFVQRQVAAHTARLAVLTVPELRNECHSRGILPWKGNKSSKKQELLYRLSLNVRDELVRDYVHDDDDDTVTAAAATTTTNNDDDDDEDNEDDSDDDDDNDDDSACSSELEIEGIGDPNVSDNDNNNTVEEHDDDSPAPNKTTRPKATTSTVTTKTNSIQQDLQDLFGYSSFRDGQEWAIHNCLNGKRSLLVAPTGFGKSLCYALPAYRLEGVCIVISPLIALMEDQLRQLPPRIPAATLSGGDAMSSSQMATTLHDVLEGRIKILFVSPERFTAPSFRRLFRPQWNVETGSYQKRPFPTVSLLCIDEAHCMSQWAHHFRPSYMRIKTLLPSVDPKAVLCLTATAGPQIVQDICTAVNIATTCTTTSDSTGIKILSTNRDNIDVHCRLMENEESRLALLPRLLLPKRKMNNNNKTAASASDTTSSDSSVDHLTDGCLSDATVLIYVWRQYDTKLVAEALQQHGVDGGVVTYHGGLDSKQRARSQSLFQRRKARICVATVAFGMGIHLDGVSAVIHLCLPDSLEQYLQEIGRAGRDGKPGARAVALLLREEEVIRKHSLAHSNVICKTQVANLWRQIKVETKRVLEHDLVVSVNSSNNNNNDSSNNESSASISPPPKNNNRRTIFIAIPVARAIQELHVKYETMETVLALLEAHYDGHNSSSNGNNNNTEPVLRLEGRVNDEVTMVVKHCTLEQLQKRKKERLASCIMKCGTRLNITSEQQQMNNDDDDHNHANSLLHQHQHHLNHRFVKSISYSKGGAYTFSVSRCANLLGDYSEPRHVYATLRRWQQEGQVELVFGGEALQLQIRLTAASKDIIAFTNDNNNNDDDDDNNTAVVDWLWTKCSNQVKSNAQKVSTMDAILRQVADVVDDDDDDDDNDNNNNTNTDCASTEMKKSKRLIKFQQLVQDEMMNKNDTNTNDTDEKNKNNNNTDIILLPKPVPPSCCQELVYDAQAVWQYLLQLSSSSRNNTNNNSNNNQSNNNNNNQLQLQLDSPGDYTILTVTKFLHGIETIIAPSDASKHHALFGKWRLYHFESIRSELEQRLE